MHGRRQRARRVLQLRLEDVHGRISPGEEAVSWDKRRKLWQAQIGQEAAISTSDILWIPRTQHGRMTLRRSSATRSQ